ncbi:MAG: trehalose utilization protein ThuA, partial [Clostridiaceae bacterium]|nr:trehalose utilization protein ThuA [Clostridiaceae bacterium]
EVFRSGCCFQRSRGKIFYFRPGHETFPVYHQPVIQRVLLNAIRWAAPVEAAPTITGLVKPLETI